MCQCGGRHSVCNSNNNINNTQRQKVAVQASAFLVDRWLQLHNQNNKTSSGNDWRFHGNRFRLFSFSFRVSIILIFFFFLLDNNSSKLISVGPIFALSLSCFYCRRCCFSLWRDLWPPKIDPNSVSLSLSHTFWDAQHWHLIFYLFLCVILIALVLWIAFVRFNLSPWAPLSSLCCCCTFIMCRLLLTT